MHSILSDRRGQGEMPSSVLFDSPPPKKTVISTEAARAFASSAVEKPASLPQSLAKFAHCLLTIFTMRNTTTSPQKTTR
jgi:hypothetical protein